MSHDSHLQQAVLEELNWEPSVVAAHLGERLSQLSGTHYTVHGTPVQLVRERINECLTAIDCVVELL